MTMNWVLPLLGTHRCGDRAIKTVGSERGNQGGDPALGSVSWLPPALYARTRAARA